MSDFPNPESYHTPFADGQKRFLSKYLIDIKIPFIVKKEKDQYIYDIDGNKYCDFCLNDGSVISGHNNKVITNYLKNGISAGSSSCFTHKSLYKLYRYISTIINFEHIAFFNSFEESINRILFEKKPGNIGVNTNYLFNKLLTHSIGLQIELVQENKEYDMIIYEPINMDGDLSNFKIHDYSGKTFIAYEGRTAFRLKYGFLSSLNNADYIVSSNNIANGLDVSMVLSRNRLKSDLIPLYKGIAILETMKYYKRKIHYGKNISADGPYLDIQRGSIIKLKKDYSSDILYTHGIILKGKILFLSEFHTEFDLKRLWRALESLEKSFL
ncbi:MAG: hypothetical protein A2355_08410 [Spirochaetes bacterium RIFOXYB1_FULL_32_8]|nr:MAG: hypothetical protein A2355_08410 [Spirochaetes bacterium RIFOXYB1_FULL_32_8]